MLRKKRLGVLAELCAVRHVDHDHAKKGKAGQARDGRSSRRDEPEYNGNREEHKIKLAKVSVGARVVNVELELADEW